MWGECIAYRLVVPCEEVVEGVVFVGHQGEGDEAEGDAETFSGTDCFAEHDQANECDNDVAGEIPDEIHNREGFVSEGGQQKEGAGAVEEGGDGHPERIGTVADGFDDGEGGCVEGAEADAVAECTEIECGGHPCWCGPKFVSCFVFLCCGVAGYRLLAK